MRNLIRLITLGVVTVCCNCSEEPLHSKAYPYVVSKGVDVSSNGAILRAEVLDIGMVAVKNYGFLIGDSESLHLDQAISIKDRKFSKGEYALALNSGLQEDKIYFVRPYVETQSYVVYGDLMSFQAKGSLAPKIISFTPNKGPIGMHVVITGENFGYLSLGSKVKFGENQASIDSISDNKLYTRVPNVTENQLVKITVVAGGMTGTSDDFFEIWFPWTRKADFPGTYLHLVSSFTAKGKLYVLGGLMINPWQIMNEFWVYNPPTNTWTQQPSFPGSMRYDAIAFSCNDKGYFGLGRNASEFLSDFWEYDPETELWSKKPDFPGTVTSQAKSFVAQNKGYVGLGYAYSTGQGFINDIWEYDPATSDWTKRKDFPSAGRYPGFSLGTSQNGYLGMGTNGWRTDDIYEYDPLVDSWKLVGNYPGFGQNDVGGFYINGNIYMGMGSNNGNSSYSDFWEFDTTLQSWKELISCPTRLSPSINVTIGNKGYIGYGWYDLTWNDQNFGRAFYEYDPSKN